MINWGVLTPTNGPRFKAPSFQWELEGFHGSLEVILWPRGFSTPPEVGTRWTSLLDGRVGSTDESWDPPSDDGWDNDGGMTFGGCHVMFRVSPIFLGGVVSSD